MGFDIDGGIVGHGGGRGSSKRTRREGSMATRGGGDDEYRNDDDDATRTTAADTTTTIVGLSADVVRRIVEECLADHQWSRVDALHSKIAVLERDLALMEEQHQVEREEFVRERRRAEAALLKEREAHASGLRRAMDETTSSSRGSHDRLVEECDATSNAILKAKIVELEEKLLSGDKERPFIQRDLDSANQKLALANEKLDLMKQLFSQMMALANQAQGV